MLLYTHAVWGLALRNFFSSTAWLSPALVRRLQENEFVYSFWYLVPDRWLWPAYALSMVVFALFTVGLFTRVTSILSLLAAVSYRQSSTHSALRPRPDQRDAELVPGHRPQRGRSLPRPLARSKAIRLAGPAHRPPWPIWPSA